MMDIIGLIQTMDTEEEREYFTRLYDEYSGKVKKVVMKFIKDATEADDLVGAVFISILEDRESFRDIDAVMTSRIIFRKTKSLCINAVKKKKLSALSISGRTEDGEPEDFDIPDDTDIPQMMLSAESAEMLKQALKTLPMLHQEIIRLKFEEEMTNVQIAGTLGMNASTVGTILNRSLVKLRKMLEGYYYD